MVKKFLSFGLLIFAFGFASALNSKAQTGTCNLQFKIFSYDAISSEKSLKDVKVALTNLKSKEEKLLTVSPTSVFENLIEGNYRIRVTKNGYKDRKKEIKLECAFADKNGIFKEHVYLWKDKSTSGSTNDFQESIVDAKSSEIASGKDKAKDVLQVGGSDGKPNDSKLVGKVTVNITINEDGNVISAKALNGNKQLAETAVKAARQAKFAPTMLAGNPVQVTGDIVYNFVP